MCWEEHFSESPQSSAKEGGPLSQEALRVVQSKSWTVQGPLAWGTQPGGWNQPKVQLEQGRPLQ